MQSLFRVRAGFDRVDPEMVRGGVLRFLLQNTLQDLQLLLLAFARFSRVVIAVVDGFGEGDTGVRIVGFSFTRVRRISISLSNLALSSEPASRIAASCASLA